MRNIKGKIYWLMLGAFVLRALLSFFGTLRLDQNTFIAWSDILVKGGFGNFYKGWSDYLPGYLYILWLLGKINLIFHIPTVFLYKLPAILSDILTGYFIYRILEKSKGERWGLTGAGIYLFNPAVFANSALWGQVDSLTALASILSIWLVGTNPALSAVSLALGTLIKPQVAFITPVLLFLMIKNKISLPKILSFGILALGVFVLGFIPFYSGGNFINFLLQRLSISANQYPYTSVNAFNFWGIFGFWKPDKLIYQYLGYFLVLGLFVFAAVKSWKNKSAAYFLASITFALSFVFFTRMHERHLLPVFAPLAISLIENPILAVPYLGFSLTYIANLYYSYNWITNDFTQVFPDVLLKFFSLLNFGFVIFIFYSLTKNLNITWHKLRLPRGNASFYKLPKVSLSKAASKLILLGILAFALFTRVFDLNSPPNEYFDEIYHAFTARIILHGDPKAWEWWNPHPEGFAYEWTHPPLSKLGMVLGMRVFGENAFGWRIPQAILGTLVVLLVYLLAKNIFKEEALPLLAAAIFSLDGLPLVLSRMGMNDIYLLFFTLLTVYCFLKEKDFWSAISFGLALASKWSAIWAIPILFVLWLKRKDKFRPSVLWFLILPFAFYILTYLPMFLTGHNLSIFWEMQKQMWWYHTGLRATHPYTSPWWSWPLNSRPVYLYTSDEVGGWVSRIYAMGNPFVFWFGLVSVFFCLIYAYLEKNKNLGLVVFSYLIFFVPWAASPRIMFLYHYLPSIPFMSIATAYVLRRNPKLIFAYLSICLLAFIYFYPHWAGLSIPLWLDRSYHWISSWR